MCETIAYESCRSVHISDSVKLREDCGRIELTDFSAIELTGEDRKGWLQGQVTNDLRRLELGGTICFCLCSATGQVEAICQLWALENRYVINASKAGAEAILERCRTRVILEDVKANPITGSIISIQGPSATGSINRLVSLPTLDAGEIELEGEKVLALRANWTGFGGWDLVLAMGSKKAAARLKQAIDPVVRSAFDALSLEAGIPLFGVDTNAKTLPPELGPAFETQHINYDKGCYTGQEVLQRIRSRGHTNKTWCGLVSSVLFSAGEAVLTEEGKEVGEVTRGAESSDLGFIAGAFVRNEALQNNRAVRVRHENELYEADLYSMPLLQL